MNKLFTKIAALALGMTMATGVGVAVASSSKEASPVQAADELVYTLSGTTTGGSSGYAEVSTITQNGIVWAVTANTTINPWRFGGKGISSTDRTAASTQTVSSSNITKVEVVTGTATATVNSVSLLVGTSQGASNISSESKTSSLTSTTLTFNRPNDKDWSGRYFTIVFNVTCGGSNQYIQMTSAKFYKESGGDTPTLSSIAVKTPPTKVSYTEGEYFAPAGLVITKTMSDASTSDVSYASESGNFTFTPNTSTALTTSHTSITIGYGGKTCNQAITVTAAPSGGDYEKASSISVGDVILLVYETGKYELNGISTTSTKYGLGVTYSTTPNGAYELTVEAGNAADSFSFKHGSDYLDLPSASNSLNKTTTKGNSSSWTVSFSSGNAVISNVTYTARSIRWNNTSGQYRFACYEGSQQAIQIYKKATNDTTTALSVSPNSWSGYDSGTVTVSNYTVSCTTSAQDDGYVFQGIGSGAGDNFVARIANFSSGHPTTSDTRLQWKAKYPTTAGGSTYLYTYVSLSVTADSVTSVEITGTMTKTSYAQNDSWNPAGFTVNAYYASAPSTPVEVTNDTGLSWSYDPLTAASLSTTSVTCTASFGGQSASKAQAVTVSAAPVTIDFVGSTTSGKWHPTASGSTFTDSAGHTATLTTDSTYFSATTPVQIGKNADPATYVEIDIPITKSGIENVSATFKSNGASSSVYVYIYGDTDNDLLASGSVTGSTDLAKIETSVSYEKINASSLKYRFEMGGTGMFISQITYTLGATVTDFGPMVSLEISTPASNTQFKEGDTFSGAGLVLLATDSHVPPMTKYLTSGFKFGTSQGDDSFTNHVFDETDAQTGTFTVHVTATEGTVTMEVTYTITVTEVPTYSPVTDYSSLYEGAKVLIVSDGKAFGEYGTNQGGAVTPVFTDDDITDANGATEFTIRIYGDKFGLQFGTYFLALNGENKQVHRNLTLTDAGAWEKDSTGIAAPIDGWYLGYDSSKSGFICASDGSVTASALYISDKAPKTALLGAETFAYKYLHMRDYTEGDGSCMNDSANHYYSTAKAFYNSASFSADEKVQFAGLTDAVARLQAWARANGESFDPSTGFGNANNRVNPIANLGFESANTITVIIIVSLIAAGTVGGYFFIRNRKEN